jgi:hypothetical protein
MSDFVITPEGVEIPTLEDLLTRTREELRAEIDATLDVSAESPEGQMAGVILSHLREAYEALQEVSDLSPRDAEGAKLDLVASLTGSRRRGATKTRFAGARSIEVNLDAGATLEAGAVAHVIDNPDQRVVTLADATNTGGAPAWILVEAEAEDPGPLVINADTLTVIATPVAGWNGVNNPFDGATGQNEEKDAAFRARRERELRKPGGAGPDALAVELESLEYEGGTPIVEAQIFRNTTMQTDARNLPPKSIEALIWDGEGQDAPGNVIAQILWNNVAAGIQTYGNWAGFALDRRGKAHLVSFSRPTLVPIVAEISVLYRTTNYVGDDAFRVALAEGLKAIAESEMVLAWSDYVDIAKEIPGVTRVLSVRVHTAVDEFEDYQMPLRTRPLFDSAADKIVLTSAVDPKPPKG